MAFFETKSTCASRFLKNNIKYGAVTNFVSNSMFTLYIRFAIFFSYNKYARGARIQIGIPSGKTFLLSRRFLSFIEYLPESKLFFRETKLKNSDWL
jgi:hypothetical protein